MEMINTHINGAYELILPAHRANRKEWASPEGWEIIHIKEMIEAIQDSDIVFDLGTELGDITALISKYTDCEIVMFEPNKKCWPSISAIWEANKLREPLFFYGGFASDKTSERQPDLNDNPKSYGGKIIEATGFSQLCEPHEEIPEITLDDFCAKINIYPTVITLDCEGGEFRIMKGAEKLLTENKPLIFMSVHEVFMWEHYKQEVGEMLRYMRSIGYSWECIDYDIHERHLVFFIP